MEIAEVRSRSKLKRFVAFFERQGSAKDADWVEYLVSDACKDLCGVVLLSGRQIRYYTKAFLGFLNHEHVKILLDENGRAAASGAAIPSLSRALQKCRGRLLPFGFLHLPRALKPADRLDLPLIGVRPALQNRGVNAVLIYEMWKTSLRHGIRYAMTGPELARNEKIQSQWRHFESRQHQRRRCCLKAI
jgi:hypothetical protein